MLSLCRFTPASSSGALTVLLRSAAAAFNSCSISRTNVACWSSSRRSSTLTAFFTLFRSSWTSSSTLASNSRSFTLPYSRANIW